MEQFCAAKGIAYEICGKVIVATSEAELPAMERIFERGQANGVKCQLIDRARLVGVRATHRGHQSDPCARSGNRRLSGRLPATGSADRGSRRTELSVGRAVKKILPKSESVIVESEAGEFEAKYVVTCAGLQSDRVAKLSGQNIASKIIPFRGEYYELKPEVQHLCRNLIYPVPDPNFPFLGVHFTRLIHGGIECGPNAVLAFAREGYRKRDISLRDLSETLAFRGFQKMAAKYWRTGLGEMWRSFSKKAFVRALQRLVPEIQPEHLTPAPSGVRAQAVLPDGTMVDDFLIFETPRVINVCNAPSPAATASLNIGRLIVERCQSIGRSAARSDSRYIGPIYCTGASAPVVCSVEIGVSTGSCTDSALRRISAKSFL